MEEIYNIESYPHVSERVNLQEYFSDFSKCLSETVLHGLQDWDGEPNIEGKIGLAMGIPLEEVDQLQRSLDISLLQPTVEEFSSPIKRPGRKKQGESEPEKVLLDRATRTLATAVELKAAKSHPLRYAGRLKEIEYLGVPEFEKANEDVPEDVLPTNVILIARIFRPFQSHTSTIPKFLNFPRAVNHEQDIMLLGSMTLDKFRDKIMCLNDDVVVGNAEDEAECSQVPMKKLITSGMFFFGETFYCDLRDTLNQDYGRIIDEWSKAHPEMRIGPFKHASMEDTLVSDLNIRLGFPYVYIHLGNCEHIITFLDARLMSPTDAQTVDIYPLVVNNENKIVYCHACDTYSRAWVVEDDKLPTKPAYLCKQCFDYFYTRKGERVNPPFSCRVPGALDSPHAGLT